MPTIPAEDPYLLRHPNWRASYQEVEDTILEQMVLDRDVGRPIQLDAGTEAVPSAGLTIYELREGARRRAQKLLELAIRRQEDPLAVMRRKAKTGEAA